MNIDTSVPNGSMNIVSASPGGSLIIEQDTGPYGYITIIDE
jgi:hypothetical protein